MHDVWGGGVQDFENKHDVIYKWSLKKNKDLKEIDMEINVPNHFEDIGEWKKIKVTREMYQGLLYQHIHVLFKGFVEYVNEYYKDKKRDEYIADFDMKHWEITNMYDGKKLFHKDDW